MSLLHYTLALFLASQATQPIVLSGYNRLTPQHVREIAAIAQDAAGAAPWLITVEPAMLYGILNIEAFVQPIAEQGALRRGHMVVVTARLSEDLNLVQSLEYRDSRDYAQVAFPDRSANDVRSSDDVNHPFIVSGEFSNEELVDIVAVFRSETLKWMGRHLRIQSISRGQSRDGSETVVSISRWRDRSSRDLFELRRENGKWSVVPTG